MASRISQPDRLLMGTLGNLEGLKRRFPAFKGIEPERIQEAVQLLDQLSMKLTAMLGRTSEATPEQLQEAQASESAARSAGQQGRNECPPNAD